MTLLTTDPTVVPATKGHVSYIAAALRLYDITDMAALILPVFEAYEVGEYQDAVDLLQEARSAFGQACSDVEAALQQLLAEGSIG